MKKITLIVSLVLALLLCTTAFAATIQMAHDVDVNDLKDCTISAVFTKDDVTDKDITVTVYEEVIYDIADIGQMKVGDTIETDEGEIEVKTMETDEYGDININGGFEMEGGATLSTEEDTNGFFQTYDGWKAHAARGTATIPFADQVTLKVYKMDENLVPDLEADYDTVTLAAADVKGEITKLAEKLGDTFYADQVTLDIEGGKITEITIDYTE